MNYELLQGDCLELIKKIPSNSIDMVLADLPYGTTHNKWDIVIPLEPLWAEYKRVLKSNGVVALFSQQPFTSQLVNSNPKDFRYEWIFQKSIATGFLNAKKMPLKSHENVLVFYKKLPTYNPQMRTGGKPYRTKRKPINSPTYNPTYTDTITCNTDGKRYPIDVVTFKSENGLHPTQKPVAMCEYLIKTYTNSGDIVLDNVMGSGTTGIACVNTNRNFIGIEQDEEWFRKAEQRIKSAYENQKI